MFEKITAALALFWVAVLVTILNLVLYKFATGEAAETSPVIVGLSIVACIFVDIAAIGFALILHADAYDTEDDD